MKRLRRSMNKCKCMKGPFSCLLVVILVVNLLVVVLLQARPIFKWSIPNSTFSQVSQRDLSESLSKGTSNSTVTKRLTAAEFREGQRTGNKLMDEYAADDTGRAGGQGRGIVLTAADREKQNQVMNKFHVNTLVSDLIALNRHVPDSRLKGCDNLTYPDDLPTASVILPFHDEWPSLLLRSIYSVINRSPRRQLQEIILVDDASNLKELKEPLQEYIEENFPEGLVRLVRVPERKGLINARMRGCDIATGDVLVFFDSHMEVNINWLPPLLTEIDQDRTTVAMSTLDYIQPDTLEYRYNVDYLTRYGWDWRLVFFETFFRSDQIGRINTSPRPGATMVGAAFAVDRKFFLELGGYDQGMKVWGGENLEMSWRVWLCGGRLTHVPCSRIGHMARGQPYSFPGGRSHIEHFNYKRAAAVWMGNFTRFVYHIYPDMKTLDVGDLSERLAFKSKLGCQDFSWYLKNVWPELNVPDENATHWGEVRNKGTNTCLDNDNYLFQAEYPLYLRTCTQTIWNQAFTMTTDGLLKTSLQCVVCHSLNDGAPAMLQDCIIGTKDRWEYTKGGQLVHKITSMCLEGDAKGPMLSRCAHDKLTQMWTFKPFVLS